MVQGVRHRVTLSPLLPRLDVTPRSSGPSTTREKDVTFRLGLSVFRLFRLAVPHEPCLASVFTSRSSSRTGGFPESGFRTGLNTLRPRAASGRCLQSKHSHCFVEEFRVEPHWMSATTEILAVEPLTQPLSGVVGKGDIF